MTLDFRVDAEQEVDGRWIGEVADLPGVLCYGETEGDARRKATVLALRVLAERGEHGELIGWPQALMLVTV